MIGKSYQMPNSTNKSKRGDFEILSLKTKKAIINKRKLIKIEIKSI